MRVFHQLQQCIFLSAALLPMVAFAANQAQTPVVTVNVHVDQAVEVYPDPLTNTTINFDPIALGNFKDPDPKVVASEFSFYVNDTTHSLQLTLTTPGGESDSSNTWMNENGGSGEVKYNVEYTTCSNGANRATIDISSNAADRGITCSNHSCTIPNEYANFFVCTPGSGGGGSLRVIRQGLNDMPEAGDYTGQFTLTASLV